MTSGQGAGPARSAQPDGARARACTPVAAPPVFDDPLSELPETARKLLLAAKRIIASDGFDALTLSRVAAESGENKAMIAYYFGNKAGLVAAVLDSVIHDDYVVSRRRMRSLDPKQRREQLVREMQHMSDAADEFVVFFELLPHVLRDDVLRHRMAELYKWYWNAKLEWLGVRGFGGADADGDDAHAPDEADGPDADLLGLSQLLSAVIDGLALQAAIDPDMDLSVPYRVFARMLTGTAALPDVAADMADTNDANGVRGASAFAPEDVRRA